jgi:glycosyltransferase involved in cell wall biosynthesis
VIHFVTKEQFSNLAVPENGGPKPRVAIMFQRFGPYHHARLNAAGQNFSVWGIEVCALEDTYAWEKVDGADAFTRVTLSERNTGDRRWKQELRRNLWRALDEIQPHAVVIPGWSSTDAFSALVWCVKNQVPPVVMSESTAWDETRVTWKEWIKNRLVKLCAAGLAGGAPHADYLAQLGLARERVFLGYDVVDNDYFSAKSKKLKTETPKLENENPSELPEKYFLASARFIEKKNLARLIRAYAEYRKKAEGGKRKAEVWDLVLLGDGPLRSSILDLRSSLGLTSFVHLPGFKQYEELPAYFGRAQVFVHASTTEQWGLVVNEAMASGLPVLVSNRCGCAKDLVADGVNGFTFDPGNIKELAQLLWRVSDPEFPLADFGAASTRIIADWGPERFADGLRQAVATAMKNPRSPVGWLDRLLLQLLLRW